MSIMFGDIQKKDYKHAVRFAIEGMQFNRYLENKLLLHLYGRYVWYLELNRATQVIAAYYDDKLVGIILAEIYGEARKQVSGLQSLYIRFFDFMQNLLYKDGVEPYDEANKEMAAQFEEHSKPEGEIIFLAADPNAIIKGIGTALLN